MLRISLPYIYNLAEHLEALSFLGETNDGYAQYQKIMQAEVAIEGLVKNSVFSQTLRSCQQSANELLSLLKPESSRLIDQASSLSQFDKINIQAKAREFKIAVLAEMGVLPSYFVTPKGGFDTIGLLDRPNNLFPVELGVKAPESSFDVGEATKALAFELATAAGFHLFRILESVLRRYYTHVSGGAAEPKVRSVKVYVRAMNKQNVGEVPILNALEQIAEFHRNPLVHPEVALTIDEALATHGIVRSVVTAMLNQLPTPPATTALPPAAPL